jgi:NAD-dependent deacetylase
MKHNTIYQASQKLAAARYAVALTGAGISVESGIPPFRGKGGVWERYDPMEYAHIDAFLANPEKVWQVFLKELNTLVAAAQPNEAHKGLARLEQLGVLKSVITQNVDGLHQAAGSRDVIEFHGTFARHSCLDCHDQLETRQLDMRHLPPRCHCGGILRPDCVFFGELIPEGHLWRSQQIASQCDVMLVLGTSAVVQPAAHLPVIAKQVGATVIEINPERTPLTGSISDYLLKGPAGEIVHELVDQVEQLCA